MRPLSIAIQSFQPAEGTRHVKLQFLGATRQVTGSRYYVEADGARVLIDCGMFQEREHQSRNWAPSPVRVRDLDALFLTHAHLDHCGLSPRLVQEGFRSPIVTTSASADLVELILRDSAEIQAEDAAFKKKRHRKEGRRGAHPEKPLYTLKDVERTLPLLKTVDYGGAVQINDHLSAMFHDAGHILGSAMIELRLTDNGRPRRVLFSGDIGQWGRPIVRDPTVFADADFVVMESTYGNRNHEAAGDAESQLAAVIHRTVEQGGKVIVPIFAIERAQEIVYHLSRLRALERIPLLPVFLDSPMAADVTEVFRRHRELFDLEAWEVIDSGAWPLNFPGLKMVRTPQQSKEINRQKGPAIIMATSGMCNAGRIKHHLARYITHAENTLLFVGYQAHGTLGRQILDGSPEVRIHGRMHPVRAAVSQIHGVSGHADRSGLLRWLSYFQNPPEHLFLTHGEEEESLALAAHIREKMGWNVTVPEYQEVVELD